MSECNFWYGCRTGHLPCPCLAKMKPSPLAQLAEAARNARMQDFIGSWPRLYSDPPSDAPYAFWLGKEGCV